MLLFPPGRGIQAGRSGHDSVEDALASLDLFKVVRRQWEPELLKTFNKRGVDVQAAVTQLARQRRDSAGEDFLHDKFWDHHIP